MKRLGEKLHSLRQSQGLTTRQLGDILGVSNVHVVRMEHGQRYPSLELVAKIARHFQVTTDQLILDDLELDEGK